MYTFSLGSFNFQNSGKLTVLLKAICSCEQGSDHLNKVPYVSGLQFNYYKEIKAMKMLNEKVIT